ncbi:MAG TPA: helix-turn-helix transcriptional regulator [Stackebrandtia sp.]|jgi:hypothetical protein|uniref:helix-turn-helix domain-containing protein n=1 Tax=Stackebrandtia sp. TaxID=2023065 RepID=UPI002D56AF52|nr:helix-turn-helix transcriptional regulator [Stackebrandtia sp.]HZE38047.1 helix-turn-helix transcriptional regulator [Stackebrandtia sp.]
MPRKQPTIRAIWLGEALRQIRDEAGLIAKDAGAHLGRDASSITRMEAGEIPVGEDLLQRFMEMCGVADPHRRADLETIRNDAAQTGWWDGYRGDVLPHLMDRAWMESKALHIKAFDITNLPGLLQTPEYAEAVMRTVNSSVSDAEIERWLEVRMTRQHILTRHHPANLSCIIDECLLNRMAGGNTTMRNQLDYILEVSYRPNIDIRILSGKKYLGTPGSFSIFELANPYPLVGYASTPVGDLCVEREKVDQLVHAYDRLSEVSLGVDTSRKKLKSERDKL